MNLGLQGKTALVTGASQGIGPEIARGLAEEGVNLILIARSEDKLAAVRQAIIDEFPVDVRTIEIDITESAAVATITEAATHIDILVNNAGNIPSGDLWQVGPEEWREGWALKVFGYIDISRAIYPILKSRGGGVIINNIGAGGDIYDTRYICGTVGNASLMTFTKTLGGRSLDDGIRVIGVNPGTVNSPRLEKIFRRKAAETLGDADRYEEFFADMPAGRPAEIREIVDTIVFLASPRSSYTTGTIVTVDGGLSTRHSIL
jgi:NAD(P)-dependent dehydrogenase (short-subunit alcohol dehydrogenase family)